MKSEIAGKTKTRTHFKKGELVITGYGAVILLLADQPSDQNNNIHGVILHSSRHPQRIGRVSESLYTSSGNLKLFEGKLILENERALTNEQ